jgi:DNA-binding MarR family transcriptional regulator
VLVACDITCRPLAKTSEIAAKPGLNRHTVGRHIARMKKLGLVWERWGGRHRKERTIIQEEREGTSFVEIEPTFVRKYAPLSDALGMLVVLGAIGEGANHF